MFVISYEEELINVNKYQTELYHHGIKGQKWGVRRYQNPDGSLTAAGRKRYGIDGLDTSKRDKVDKLSDKKKQKAAKKELKKLYRKIDRRSDWDEYQAEEEKNRRSQDYRQKKADDQNRQIDREMEKKKWAISDDDEEEEDEWWLDDEEKALKAELKAQQKERQRDVEAAKREASIRREAEKDTQFESKNEKQYQEELRKIQKGKEEAKRQVDAYISKKYGLSKASVSILNGSSKVKKGSAATRSSKIQSLMDKIVSEFEVDQRDQRHP